MVTLAAAIRATRSLASNYVKVKSGGVVSRLKSECVLCSRNSSSRLFLMKAGSNMGKHLQAIAGCTRVELKGFWVGKELSSGVELGADNV